MALIPVGNLSEAQAEINQKFMENVSESMPMIDWTDPNILVTTYSDLGIMIFIIGFVYLIAGYLVGSMRNVKP